jgi:hypothetical protein
MKNKILLLSVVSIVIITLTSFNVTKEETTRKEVFLYHAIADIKSEKSAQITQVSLIEEKCNAVKYKVSYINTNHTKGFFRLSVSSKVTDNNYDGFRGDHSPKLITGAHSSNYSEWITTERKSAKTNEVWVSIEEIVNKRFHNISDRVKIKFKKEWDHNCIK